MLTSLVLLTAFAQIPAQNVRPQIGYVYPPGGKAGTTIDVMLGTYDWTPDMQVLSADPRVKIEITGPAGDFLLTPPPYWFGQKAGQAQPPLPREVPARITLPADLPPGPIQWRVANANGGSNVGTFVVSDGAEFVEPDQHAGTLDLPALPVVANGRLSRITEIDTYKFTVPDAGLVTVRLADRVGQAFHGVLTIRDAVGKVMADGADTTGDDVVLLFTAQAGATYTATVTDLEFAGDRGYVYRLSIARGPRRADDAAAGCQARRNRAGRDHRLGRGDRRVEARIAHAARHRAGRCQRRQIHNGDGYSRRPGDGHPRARRRSRQVRTGFRRPCRPATGGPHVDFRHL